MNKLITTVDRTSIRRGSGVALEKRLPRETTHRGIAVLDAGGQYCHLIARRLRSVGVHSEVLPFGASSDLISRFSGLVLSGSPASTRSRTAPSLTFDPLDLKIPVLGICYGYQLLSALTGSKISNTEGREYGPALFEILRRSALLRGVDKKSIVWMSHGDRVETLSAEFEALGTSSQGFVAAIQHKSKKIFGVQFHPEVSHTRFGTKILKNFAVDICKCKANWAPSQLLRDIRFKIQEQARDRRVLFFVSGGVDSAVALWLTADALHEKGKVHGVFLDTGFQKSDDYDAVKLLSSIRRDVIIETLDASDKFLASVEGITDPELKRRAIGKTFYDVMEDYIKAKSLDDGTWVIGQGTIYPDTIETGGTDKSVLIKTHHNRVDAFLKLKDQGLLLEPLSDFYKDEVRAIAKELHVPIKLSEKHPFPGPGLAVRCICSDRRSRVEKDAKLSSIAEQFGLESVLAPIHSVGIKGDERSYDKLAILKGPASWKQLEQISRAITNSLPYVNRVAWLTASGFEEDLISLCLSQSGITRERIHRLREADRLVGDFLKEHALYSTIWQCPVVSVPLCFHNGETIAIRPIESVDGMTARFSKIQQRLVMRLSKLLLQLSKVEAILYDITNKPPGTIEWE